MRGALAVAAVILVVGGIILLGRSDAGNSGQPPPEPGKTNNPPTVKLLPPVVAVLECEDGRLTAEHNGVTLFTIKEQSEGKTIKFIQVAGDEEFMKSGLKKDFMKEPETNDTLPGKAVYDFEVPRDDTYYVNLRAQWFDTCGNSVWVKIDDGKYYSLEDEEGKIADKNYRWAWHQLLATGMPKGFELKAGKHTLTMALREHGMRLDKWAVTTDANPPAWEFYKK